MSGEELALLAAVLPSPADDTPRLVYADWLDEHGEEARGEFVRVQCELAKLLLFGQDASVMVRHYPEPRKSELTHAVKLQNRERELMRRHAGNWLPPGLGYLISTGSATTRNNFAIVRRGFVDEIRCSWEAWQSGAESLYWRTEVACPWCRDYGRGAGCVCGDTGRVRNPDPPPATAQPVVSVRLTTWPEFDRHGPCGVCAACRDGRFWDCAGYHSELAGWFPGITFTLPDPLAFGDFPRVQVPREAPQGTYTARPGEELRVGDAVVYDLTTGQVRSAGSRPACGEVVRVHPDTGYVSVRPYR